MNLSRFFLPSDVFVSTPNAHSDLVDLFINGWMNLHTFCIQFCTTYIPCGNAWFSGQQLFHVYIYASNQSLYLITINIFSKNPHNRPIDSPREMFMIHIFNINWLLSRQYVFKVEVFCSFLQIDYKRCFI